MKYIWATLFLASVLGFLTACSEPAEVQANESKKDIVEMYKPNARVVDATMLTLQDLDAADEDPNTKVVREHTFSNGESFTYVTVDGLVVDGDVVLGTIEELEKAIEEHEDYLAAGGNSDTLSPQGAMRKPGCTFWFFNCFGPVGKHWKNGVVYYDVPLSNDFTQEQKYLIYDAMDHVRLSVGNARVRFVAANSGDRIRFTNKNDGCWSYYGKQGGVQNVNLADGCFARSSSGVRYGIIVHEIGHAIGMIHEHQRPDRDTYVRINGGDAQNYSNKFSTETRTIYDYGSIMHYRPGANITILRSYSGEIGQRNGLNRLDIEAIRQRYP